MSDTFECSGDIRGYYFEVKKHFHTKALEIGKYISTRLQLSGGVGSHIDDQVNKYVAYVGDQKDGAIVSGQIFFSVFWALDAHEHFFKYLEKYLFFYEKGKIVARELQHLF